MTFAPNPLPTLSTHHNFTQETLWKMCPWDQQLPFLTTTILSMTVSGNSTLAFQHFMTMAQHRPQHRNTDWMENYLDLQSNNHDSKDMFSQQLRRDNNFRTKLTNFQKEQLTNFLPDTFNSRVLCARDLSKWAPRENKTVPSQPYSTRQMRSWGSALLWTNGSKLFGSWIPLRIWWKLQILSLQGKQTNKQKPQPNSGYNLRVSKRLLLFTFTFTSHLYFPLCQLEAAHTDHINKRELEDRTGQTTCICLLSILRKGLTM